MHFKEQVMSKSCTYIGARLKVEIKKSEHLCSFVCTMLWKILTDIPSTYLCDWSNKNIWTGTFLINLYTNKILT